MASDSSFSEPGLIGSTHNGRPAGSRITHQVCIFRTRFAPFRSSGATLREWRRSRGSDAPENDTAPEHPQAAGHTVPVPPPGRADAEPRAGSGARTYGRSG